MAQRSVLALSAVQHRLHNVLMQRRIVFAWLSDAQYASAGASLQSTQALALERHLPPACFDVVEQVPQPDIEGFCGQFSALNR